MQTAIDEQQRCAFPAHQLFPAAENAGPQFEEQGWALMRAFASPSELVRLRSEALSLLGEKDRDPKVLTYSEGAEAGGRLVRLERIWHCLPALSDTDLGERLATVASGLLRAPVALFKDKLNMRYPASPGYAPHQDVAAGWLEFGNRFVTLCLLLDRSSTRTGGFQVAPGRHRQGLLANEAGRMSNGAFEALGPAPIAASAGDLLVFDGLAPHRTLANRSRRTTLHLLFTFVADGVPGARESYYRKKIANFTVSDDNTLRFRVFAFEPPSAAAAA
jgi:hypothetical protein